MVHHKVVYGEIDMSILKDDWGSCIVEYDQRC